MKTYCLLFCCILFAAGVPAEHICKTNSIPASTPDSQLIDNGDTVTDSKTGLMWKKCVEGLSGTHCENGSADSFTWQQALQQPRTVNNAGGFADYTDWRLPNINELISIVEEQCSDPAINLSRFPNTPSSVVWSGSPVAVSDYAWSVGFGSGSSDFSIRDTSISVRLVRGGNLDEGPLPCGGPQEEAGKDTSEIHSYNMGTNSGSFQFDYETYSIKDRIIIKHDNLQIFDTGCVGESKTVTINFSGSNPVISVEVIPNCAGSSGTKWTYTVHCPN